MIEMREWAGQLPGEPETHSARSPTYADTAAKAMEAGNFHESEMEKHFEQNTKGKMSCEWTFERAVGRTARPCARVDAQACSEVHGIMHGPTCAQGRRTTRSSQRSPSRSWKT
mmetsp:Transcript_19334/g.67334  ORF Transcript_19334/g.67334 Transcript_19334/m.67334 type:complete len:113 (-) Transcript_19334:67-405(-)